MDATHSGDICAKIPTLFNEIYVEEVLCFGK
uniref:Uncharacterized protein n=1 Tax=Heterorhabditis bacteriophora TaxID=37862 RepID=A0A1I7X1I5_HETBA